MACIVVFCTTYALILPAITLEKGAVCGMNEHIHTASCYTQVTSVPKTVPACPLEVHAHTEDCYDEADKLICGLADFVVHQHDDRCYDENGDLWCPLPEIEAHTHDAACYTTPETHVHGENCYTMERGALLCTQSTDPAHVHTEDCYTEKEVLLCGQEEGEAHHHEESCYGTEPELTCGLTGEPAHTHVESCYEWSKTLTCTLSTEPAKPKLTCDKPEIVLHEHTGEDCYALDEEGNLRPTCPETVVLEHVHTEACFQTVEEPVDTETLTCGQEEGESHTHTPLCHGTWILTCGKEEHTHVPACYVETETADIWEATLPQAPGVSWAEDLVAVAESQLDYTEIRPDLHLGEDTQPYTRYGQWYGQPYGNWNSLFVMFCLHYAGIPEERLPQDTDPALWVEKLAGQAEGFEGFQLYREGEGYIPRPGDLVFFALGEDETAQRVGIVTAYTEAGEETPAALETIEGDVSGKVAKQDYPQEHVRILGYAELPEKRTPLCGKEAHTHTEACSSPDPEGTGLILTCGKEAHTHTEDCYIPRPQEYNYEDDTLSATVVLPAGSQVPKDATLRVTPIPQGETLYSLLERQAQAAVDGAVGQLVLYDVSFYTQAGEYLPVEETADVTITFKQEVFTGEQVEVIHYGANAVPVALEGVEIQRGENEALSGLSFQTDGFSVFGLMSTRSAYVVTPPTLYPGQVFTTDVVYTPTPGNTDDRVVSAVTVTNAQILKTGTTADYSGERVDISNALYTFRGNNTDGFQISNGTCYLQLINGKAGFPNGSETNADSILFDDAKAIGGDPGAFAIRADNAKYLFFHRNASSGNKYSFDRYGSYENESCQFLLFKPDDTQSSPIPGYVQVTTLDDIVDNGQYLIVAEAQDGAYYLLYPSTDTSNRYTHVAKISPYTMTLTALRGGNSTITVGDQATQEWEVTVNDVISLNRGENKTIQLPAGAAAVAVDPAIAGVTVDIAGLVTVTGLKSGNTDVTVTVDGKEYTWHISVAYPDSFQLTCGDKKVTFYLRDKNSNPLQGEAADIAAEQNQRYVIVESGAAEPTEENVKNLVVPTIPGYQYTGATYPEPVYPFARHPVCSIATTTYVDSSNDNVTSDFRFYRTEPLGSELYNVTDNGYVSVYLNYEPLPLTTTVSPSGTTINLFDYWVTGKDEGQVGGKKDEGINQGHALQFTTDGKTGIGHLPLNCWTGYSGHGVLQGIVAKELGNDGYPYLSGALQESGNNTESLAYLFDPAYSGDSAQYRTTYQNVGNLLQIDDDGYYYYNSAVNYAEFDQDANQFLLYPDWAVTFKTFYGQFFPFNPYSTVNHSTDGGTTALNHFLGMTMTTRFIQIDGGYTGRNGKTPVTYEFSGDDDVWIFIDGVLVADLGGIHDPASVKIDFSEGTVVISKVNGGGENVITRFRDIFAKTNVSLNSSGVFHDNTYHTLKFYYMERGGNASNLHLKFNLVTFPASGITKVDQVGDPIQGAEFSLYRTGPDYNVDAGEPICTGTTGANGEFIFTGDDGHPLVLQDLYQGQSGNETYPYYVLREISIPEGYRGTGTDIHLQILEGGSAQGDSGSTLGNVQSYVMTCTNTRDSGAYASPSLQVTASSSLRLAGSNKEIIPGESNGSLFGIVLKYIGPEGAGKDGAALADDANWSPVYGSAAGGYTIVDRSNGKSIQQAIHEAKDHYIGNQNYFHQSSNGSFQALIEDLPGNIGSYNFMVGNDHPEQIQYIVSYYWTDGATGQTTRVQDYTINGGVYSFARTFGTNIQVPNMKNRIAVQKLDDITDSPVNGASFAMYRVDDQSDAPAHSSEAYFFVPDRSASQENKIHIFLEPDTSAAFAGKARLCTDETYTGTYTVDRETGKITVEIQNDTYYITPVQVVTTVGEDHNSYKEDGIAEFDENIVTGKYIIRELTAPPGYSVNPNRAMVLVTDNAIYANAGTADDGIAVSRGPGYLAGNLHYYASIGEIESSLTWVYDQMKVSEVSNSFADVTSGNYANWKWVQTKRADANTPGAAEPTENRGNALTAYLKYISPGDGGSDSETSARFSYAVEEGRPHTVSDNVGPYRRLYTNTGWSYLEILQDYDYGKTAKSEHANYENWQYLPGTTTPDDLSNLFSRSIYVHVTDPRLPGSLEISKKVVMKDGTELSEVQSNQSFGFTVGLANPTQKVDGTYNYTVYDNTGGNRTVVEQGGEGQAKTGLTFTGGTATVSLKHNQSIVIDQIPAGSTYEIKEDTPPKYTTTAVEKVLADNAESRKEHNGAVVSGPMYWNGEDRASKVDFTNTYDVSLDTVMITVRKVNAEDQTARLAGAEFTLTRVTADGKTEYNTGSAWTETETALTTSAISGEILFPLIEEGDYTLTEVTAPEGYYLLTEPITIRVGKSTVEGTEQTVIQSATMGETTLPTDGENSLTLIVPNNCGFELPHSGGTGTTGLYTAGTVLLLTALLLLIIPKRKPANQ